MDEKEIIKLVEIMCQADGGCSHCSHALCDDLKDAFPEFKALIISQWEKEEELKWTDRP